MNEIKTRNANEYYVLGLKLAALADSALSVIHDKAPDLERLAVFQDLQLAVAAFVDRGVEGNCLYILALDSPDLFSYLYDFAIPLKREGRLVIIRCLGHEGGPLDFTKYQLKRINQSRLYASDLMFESYAAARLAAFDLSSFVFTITAAEQQ